MQWMFFFSKLAKVYHLLKQKIEKNAMILTPFSRSLTPFSNFQGHSRIFPSKEMSV